MADACLNPHCVRSQLFARGLCRVCYQTARTYVVRGDITWDELERTGRALPARRRTSRGKTVDWLLSREQEDTND